MSDEQLPPLQNTNLDWLKVLIPIPKDRDITAAELVPLVTVAVEKAVAER